ncbi:MAG: hypothetical protein GX249_07290 [Firmicutes bacterium]|nr:hypothetical protein [Bacillota bacterium]
MMAFFGEIVELLQPLQPLVVFLHRPNLRLSYEKAFQASGERWRSITMREPEPYGYFALHSYSGDESIFGSLLYEQESMAKVFDSLSVAKLKIDTTDELWGHYARQITEAAGYVYASETGTQTELSKYCGKYQIEGGEAIWTIRYDEKSQPLYSSLFWPYMPMEYSGNDTLEFVSFPISLKFIAAEDPLTFTVQGNYDWKYNGRTFKRLTSGEL